ncbi:MAG: amidohydrolase family protein, partial [Planctomycetota bacterium]
GLLRRSTALIHANDPRGDEIERVARSEASIVHCPGAARFFDRDSFPMERWREAGVPVAIGTDSAAGNDSLSMLRELKLLRRSQPELDAAECFAMATVYGARALGLEGLVGSLTEGAFADLCLWPLARTLSREEALERLTRGGVDGPSGLWIQGRARSLSH